MVFKLDFKKPEHSDKRTTIIGQVYDLVQLQRIIIPSVLMKRENVLFVYHSNAIFALDVIEDKVWVKADKDKLLKQSLLGECGTIGSSTDNFAGIGLYAHSILTKNKEIKLLHFDVITRIKTRDMKPNWE